MTLLRIGNNTFHTDIDTAIEVYRMLEGKTLLFNEYSDDPLTPLDPHCLSICASPPKLEDNAAAAKALGEKYYEYIRNIEK